MSWGGKPDAATRVAASPPSSPRELQTDVHALRQEISFVKQNRRASWIGRLALQQQRAGPARHVERRIDLISNAQHVGPVQEVVARIELQMLGRLPADVDADF